MSDVCQAKEQLALSSVSKRRHNFFMAIRVSVGPAGLLSSRRSYEGPQRCPTLPRVGAVSEGCCAANPDSTTRAPSCPTGGPPSLVADTSE